MLFLISGAVCCQLYPIKQLLDVRKIDMRWKTVSLFVDGAMSSTGMFIELVSLRKKKANHDWGMFAIKCTNLPVFCNYCLSQHGFGTVTLVASL